MMKNRMTRAASINARRGLAGAALLLALFVCLTSTEAQAQGRRRQERVEYALLEVSTNPGGFPILIDGNAAGETTSSARSFQLTPGPHTVEIQFPNNRWVQQVVLREGRRECISLNYNPRNVTVPQPVVSPCPYPVNVSAPATINEGELITFSADVGYAGQSALNYTWTVSPPSARIVSGAGTPTITVDTTGLSNRRVTAILVVDDGSGDRNCRQTSQASTGVVGLPPRPLEPRRFDEFPSVTFDDDKARLDNFAIELQNSPGAVGYIISYGGRASRAGRAELLGTRARNYLVRMRGIDASRLMVLDGGYRERDSYELWVVPQGAEPPRPTPTVSEGEVLRGGRRRR